jgi:hypothetical protein
MEYANQGVRRRVLVREPNVRFRRFLCGDGAAG